MRRLIVLLIAVCACSGALSAPAFAQEDGVFYDSDDAAGKEYAIPTEEARRGGRDREDDPGPATGGSDDGGDTSEDSGGAGGGGKDEPRAGDGAPLFGSGISPKGRSAGDEAGPSASAPPRASFESTSGDTSPAVWMGGLALLVLLLGAGGAFAVRRRQTV